MAPLADELLIVPYGPYTEAQAQMAVLCAIPLASTGVSIHVRPLDTQFTDPMASYDEPDAMVRLDQVEVPLERVWLQGSAQVGTELFRYSTPFAYFTGLVRAVVRLEFLAALGHGILQSIGCAHFQQNRLALGDIAAELLSMKGLVDAAVERASVDPVRQAMSPAMEYVWAGLARCGAAGKRFLSLITEQCGNGILMRLDPSKIADSDESRRVAELCLGDGITADAKSSLLRMAWSLAMGPVGARQRMFDVYAFGDPMTLRTHVGTRFDWKPGFDLLQQAIYQMDKQRDRPRYG
jgi:4-hydroxyphenylacetate 3-monooxygenase